MSEETPLEKWKRGFREHLDAEVASGAFQKYWDGVHERDRLRSLEKTDHLLPCPCCGGKAIRYPGEYQGDGLYENIRCSVCYLGTKGIWGELNAEDVWQRRVNK